MCACERQAGTHVSHIQPPNPPTKQERTSLVFFYYPSFDTPLPSAPAPAAAPSSSHQPRKEETSSNGEAYNTLLDAKAAGAGAGGITFGQHLMRKWAGVSS